jgi:hypothetical protein
VETLTFAISLSLPDGVILGVDSAVTLAGKEGILKIYEHAQKLFQLGEKPVGIATYGIASLGDRSIGSFIREFEILNPKSVVSNPSSIKDIVEELRAFLCEKYQGSVVPLLEKGTGKRFDELKDDEKPILGIVVGGFSSGAYLPEVWEIIVPIHNKPNGAKLWNDRGVFGSTWFSLNQPIVRYVKGFDPTLMQKVVEYYEKLRGKKLTPTEEKELGEIVSKFEYAIPFSAMPLEEGVAYVRFFVEMVINHYRFAVGASVVGGKANIGLVTYKGEKFQIL